MNSEAIEGARTYGRALVRYYFLLWPTPSFLRFFGVLCLLFGVHIPAGVHFPGCAGESVDTEGKGCLPNHSLYAVNQVSVELAYVCMCMYLRVYACVCLCCFAFICLFVFFLVLVRPFGCGVDYHHEYYNC